MGESRAVERFEHRSVPGKLCLLRHHGMPDFLKKYCMKAIVSSLSDSMTYSIEVDWPLGLRVPALLRFISGCCGCNTGQLGDQALTSVGVIPQCGTRNFKREIDPKALRSQLLIQRLECAPHKQEMS